MVTNLTGTMMNKDMTDLEISKALALAIGWKDVAISGVSEDAVCVRDDDDWWRTFDYRDWNVIGPIAERYDCFPLSAIEGGWFSHLPSTPARIVLADTPQKAIALAVIQGVKK